MYDPTKEVVKLSELPNSTIAYIQDNLVKVRLLDPPIDGIAGPKTHKAWALFKRATKCIELDIVNVNDLIRLTSCVEKCSYRVNNSLITKEELQQVFLKQPTDKQVKDLNDCLEKNDIVTTRRMAHFLSQTGHESGGLHWLVELADGSAYEGRTDLGNTQPGDGRQFKGSGVLQMTGRYNYLRFSEYVNDPEVMQGCHYVAEHYPFSSAGWFWTTHNLNKLCDDGASVAAITKVVNGGTNGLQDRLAYYARAKEMLVQRQSFFVQSLC